MQVVACHLSTGSDLKREKSRVEKVGISNTACKHSMTTRANEAASPVTFTKDAPVTVFFPLTFAELQGLQKENAPQGGSDNVVLVTRCSSS